MATHIPTLIQSFADSDPDHPCALIVRVGGGVYKITDAADNPIGDPKAKLSLEEAEAFVDQFAADLDAAPLPDEDRVKLARRVKQLEADSAAKDARIAELEAAQAAEIVAPVKG